MHIKLFHPTGIEATISFDGPCNDFDAISAAIYSRLQSGWLATPPAQPEQIDEVGYVARRSQDNSDDTVTPILDIYPNDRRLYKLLHIYLNTPADIRAFEKASGLELARLPAYDGNQALKRGEAKGSKHIIRLPHPIQIIWKENPLYEGDEDTKHPKRLLVRWGISAPRLETQEHDAGDAEISEPEEDRCPVCHTPNPKHTSNCSDFVQAVKKGLYADDSLLNGSEAEQKAYEDYTTAEKQLPANIDTLRAWARSGQESTSN